MTVHRGDIDRDQSVSVGDAILALRAAVGLQPLNAEQRLIADVTGEGQVNISDVTLILRHVAGLLNLGQMNLPSPSDPLTVSVDNNETVFDWPNTEKSAAQLVFTQGANRETLVRNIEDVGGRDRVRLNKLITHQIRPGVFGSDYALFEEFAPDQPVTVAVSLVEGPFSPLTPVGSLQFTPTVHEFDLGIHNNVEPALSLNTSFPDTAGGGQAISLSGTALERTGTGSPQIGLRTVAYVIPPSGIPVSVDLTSSDPFDPNFGTLPRIPPGSDFRFNYPLGSTGTYVVELLDASGRAVFHRPIYAGGAIPLLPGRLDYLENPQVGAPVDVAQARTQWLARINQDRTRYGLDPVVLDDDLNEAAQAHSVDMTTFNYFGHFGRDNSTPQQRAVRAGVRPSALIEENIVQGATPDFLHDGLMVNALSRSFILDPRWKRVGMGVARANNGFLLGTQLFMTEAGSYTIPVDHFAGIVLDQPLPTSLTAGQPFVISGRATMAGAENVVVFFRNLSTNVQVFFPEGPTPLDANGRFSIPVLFDADDAGEYTLGISLNSMASRTANIVVTSP